MGLLSRLFGDPRTCGSSRSPRWATVAREHLRRQPECQACGDRDANHVHHIRPFHVVPDSELDPTNLITLCPRCHLFVGHLGQWSSWNAEVVADAWTWRRKIIARPVGECE